MEATNEKVKRPFGNKDKWLYALGDFGCNMSFALKNFITIFYTMYIGLDYELMAIIILALNIWDGINDPIVGALIDRIKPGKYGKFKPWIFWGAVALIVSGAMVFLPIAGAPLWLKIVVCILGYLVWDMAYTVVNVPYGSMASVITIDPSQRASLSKFRTIGAMLAALPVGIIVPMIMYNYITDPVTGKVMLDAEGNKMYTINGMGVFILALVLGVVGFIAFAVMVKYTVERVEPEVKEETQKVSYLEVIKSFGKNRAAIGMTVASIFQLIMMQGLATANSVLYTSYFVDVPNLAQNSGTISMISYVPMIAAIFLVNPLVEKFGKKKASEVPLLGGIVAGFLMAIIPFGTGVGGLVLWLVLNTVVSCSVGILSMVGWAMIADCIDYQELKTGRREEGTVYAIYSLGRKFAQGIGASLVLLIMGWIGCKSVSGEMSITQAPDVANNVRIMVGLIYGICCLAQYISIKYIYNLGKKEVEEMQIALGRVNKIDAPHPED